MLKRLLTMTLLSLALSTPAFAASDLTTDAAMAPPSGDYKEVSTLVALPNFIPGLGTLYVQPATLPAGPFLAYDRSGKLVSSIFMIPIDDMAAQKKFAGLGTGAAKVHSVDMYYNAGHPGVDTPHYHVTLWHVAPETAQLK